MSAETKILEVKDLTVTYSVSGKKVRAVRGVDLSLSKGEILGLVGETGSGKTTVGKAVVRLVKPSSGQISIGGVDVTTLSRSDMRPVRRQVQMVFQDPYSSLNPRMTVLQLVEHPLKIHNIGTRTTRKSMVGDIIERVGLSKSVLSRYPGEMSGGQRQRVGLARSLVLSPALLVADEPVSALDVSVQAGILNLLVDLQKDLGFSCLFITHDLGVAEHLCDRVAVMYLGEIVEVGTRDDVLARGYHPYTKSLLDAVPVPDPVVQRNRKKATLPGDPPDPLSPPSGCALHPRCRFVVERCMSDQPELLPLINHKEQLRDVEGELCRSEEIETKSPVSGHLVRCHRVEDAFALNARDAVTSGSSDTVVQSNKELEGHRSNALSASGTLDRKDKEF